MRLPRLWRFIGLRRFIPGSVYPSHLHSGTHGEIPRHQRIRARAPLWWSADRSFEESIQTLHWRPDDRRTEGVLRSRVFDSLPYLGTRRWGGLHSSRWTRVNGKLDRGCDGVEVRSRCGSLHTTIGVDVITWNPSRDHLYTRRVLDMSHPDL